MTTRKTRTKAQDGAQIVKAIFAAAESMGIADRNVVEQLTGQVLQRLGAAPTLPGMEDLVAPRPAPEAVKAVIKEVLPPPAPAQPGAIQLTENALRVLERRYLKKDDQGQPAETPQEMFRRVAHNIAQAELLYDGREEAPRYEAEFYRMMTSLDFLPNSPTLMNAGRELQQLSACFVLPVGDSMEEIFDAVKYTALIHKSGGGTGFSFSRLRPEGDVVGSTGGVASGPVSFMRAFDTATEVIKQGGMRRGANMGILSVHHPDIRKFITAKEDPRAFVNFNISVAVSDAFMKAVEADGEYDLINPRNGQVHSRVRAREVLDLIVDSAWRTGDPGVVFIDRINEANPTPHLGSIEATNPCGEQPLLPFESCNLGSINLARMLRRAPSSGSPKESGVLRTGQANGRWEIDWERLERTVTHAVHFLDNVIDMNNYPTPEIARMTRTNRKIGLGVMGFADALLRLGIPYDSEEALRVAEEVMGFINRQADAASAALVGVRGTFPAFTGSIYDRPAQPRLRNSTRTTIAPTGTLSIIAGCSSGIEPLYALYFERHILDNQRLVELNPVFEEVAREEGFYSPELIQALADGKPLKDIPGVPERVKRLFVTAHDITPEWHVKMQAAFQKFTDNAVSKTVNLPHHATREEVAQVYMMAYGMGLKGITIFRDRSKGAQVLSVPGAERGDERVVVEEVSLTPRRRSKELHGVTEKVVTGCGNIYVTVNSDGKGVCEVFASLGKAGGCASAQLEATSRLISVALRSGVDAASLVKHLKGIRCPSIAWEGGHAVLSCADAIARVLEKHMGGVKVPEATLGGGNGSSGDGEQGATALAEPGGVAGNIVGTCPECGSGLIYQEGCYLCHACGYTKC